MIHLSKFNQAITAKSFQIWANTHQVNYSGLNILLDSGTGRVTGEVIKLGENQDVREVMHNIARSTCKAYKLTEVENPLVQELTNSVTIQTNTPSLLAIKKVLWLTDLEHTFGKIVTREAVRAGEGIVTFNHKATMNKFLQEAKHWVKDVDRVFPYFTHRQRRKMVVVQNIPEEEGVEEVIEHVTKNGPIELVRTVTIQQDI